MQLGGGEEGCKDPRNPPATGHQVRGRAAPSPSHSSPPFPSTEPSSSEEHEDEQPQQPAASLPEDALVEILSRVPYRSLRRFSCVSKPWLALCSDPKIRRRCPQTLSGFFYSGLRDIKFHNLLAGGAPPMLDPSMPFLRESYMLVILVQCCNSLLLCQCLKWTPGGGCSINYVVCNPATEKWDVIPPIALPGREERPLDYVEMTIVYLGFDAAVPSRFVLFVPHSGHCDETTEVAIYSSQTGRWTSVQNEWGDQAILHPSRECVFVNGTMHITTLYSSVATVDAGKKLEKNPMRPGLIPSMIDPP
ncbi:F-box protein At5g07610-like [Lolium perenne]|uniref:F-box protein At5g07610-like n=1 Tax=Lolium perenne TaxID=4522 RepID=UPI0021F64727|nr:F-box protein At5g07610-like [Lolium perenne]